MIFRGATHAELTTCETTGETGAENWVSKVSLVNVLPEVRNWELELELGRIERMIDSCLEGVADGRA